MGSLRQVITSLVFVAVVLIAYRVVFRRVDPHFEAMAVGSLRTVNAAMKEYYLQTGRSACSLNDLGNSFINRHGFRQDALIDQVLASGAKASYRFKIKDCKTDRLHYLVTAEPIPEMFIVRFVKNESAGTRSFCTDESGEIHESNGSAADCLIHGRPLP